jgi:hypothetical protein
LYYVIKKLEQPPVTPRTMGSVSISCKVTSKLLALVSVYFHCGKHLETFSGRDIKEGDGQTKYRYDSTGARHPEHHSDGDRGCRVLVLDPVPLMITSSAMDVRSTDFIFVPPVSRG